MRLLIFITLIIFIIPSFGMAQNTYKNLKVLNIKSEHEMRDYMKAISKDLGVRCTFCHDINDKSKDTHLKNIAREMIIMQRNLNNDYFPMMTDSTTNQNIIQISCWTCHRGQSKPQLTKLK